MINPDNKVTKRSNSSSLESVTETVDGPKGSAEPEKFREVYGVTDQKKRKDMYEDLKGGKRKKRDDKGLSEEGIVTEDEEDDDKKNSIFDLAKDHKEEHDVEKTAPKPTVSEVPKFEVEKKSKNDYLIKDADLTHTPSSQPIQPVHPIELSPFIDSTKETKPAARADLQEIIDKIVNEVYKLENKETGETSTTLILKNEGPLKDVAIKISEFDTSQKQLNITIDNLSQEAKALLDKNQSALMLALDRKGYQVQQLTITTAHEIERYSGVDSQHLPQRDGSKQEEQKKQQRERQQEAEDNE